VRQALNGDAAPLVRLATVTRRTLFPVPASIVSFGLHTATLCSDMSFPWGGTLTPLGSRSAAVSNAIARIPVARFYPFDAKTAAGNGLLNTCRRWAPTKVAAPPPPGPLPSVPTLMLSGSLDPVTPPINARKEMARSSRASLVIVPGAGHAVLETSGARCLHRALVEFFAAGRLTSNPCAKTFVAALAVVPDPRTAATLPTPPGIGGARGRITTAALRTIADTRAMRAMLDAAAPRVLRDGGLRGGSFTINGDTGAFTLRADRYFADVAVSGKGDLRNGRPVGVLTVRAGALSGHLTISRTGSITGELGHRPIHGRLPRS
jgi:hypothetical protein